MPLILESMTTVVATGFECDKCHKVVYETDWLEYQERLEWHHSAGYGSVWGDENEVSVVLCQNCAYEVFKKLARIDTT